MRMRQTRTSGGPAQRDKDIQHPASLSDSEDEGTGGRRDHYDASGGKGLGGRPRRKGRQKPSIMDGGRYQDTPTDEEVFAQSKAKAAGGGAAQTGVNEGSTMDVDMHIKAEEESAIGEEISAMATGR